MVWVIRVFILTITLSVAACANVNSQYDCNFLQNTYGQRISWHQRLPVVLYVHKSFPVDNLRALYAAINQWNTAINRKMLVVAGTDNGDNIPKRDGVSVIYWLYDWESNLYNEEGRTTIYYDGNYIMEADVRVNAKNFKYSLDTPNSTTVDLESLLVHELGHVLGLKHNLAPGSVMNPFLSNGVKRRDPSQFDLSSLECEYNQGEYMHSRITKIKEINKNNFSVTLYETHSGNYSILTISNNKKEFSESTKDLKTALFIFDEKLKELEGN